MNIFRQKLLDPEQKLVILDYFIFQKLLVIFDQKVISFDYLVSKMDIFGLLKIA